MPNIVIDFDGTICEHDFPRVGAPKPGVKEALTRLKELGFTLIVHSCRTATYWDRAPLSPTPAWEVLKIKAFMNEHEIPYDDVWLPNKQVASYYIDDRAIGFHDNWADITKYIEQDVDVCTTCGQSEMGQTGEKPCDECGRPTVWDTLGEIPE